MNSKHPVTTRFLNAFLILILLPLYFLMLFHPYKGLVWAVVRWGELELAVRILVSATLLVTVAGSAFLVGRTREFLFLMFFLFLFLYPFVNSFLGNDSSSTDYIVMGNEIPNRGVDVYCNDVYLGKTPLRIPKQEFLEKVAKWETPPAQPMVDIWVNPQASNYEEMKFTKAKFYYYPSNPLTVYEDLRVRGVQTVSQRFLEGRYFWHFGKGGCAGLTEGFQFGLQSSAWGGTDIHTKLNIHYPCLEPVLRILLLDLRRNGGKPTPEWTLFVEKHLEFLFFELLKYPDTGTGLKAAVRKRYGIPEAADEKDAQRVMDAVLARAEKEKAFVIPSPESMAIDMLGPTVETYTAIAYPKYLEQPTYGMGAYGWSSQSNSYPPVYFYRDRSNAALPLEYAIRRYTPDALYDDLLYAYSQSKTVQQYHGIALLSFYYKHRTQDQFYNLYQKQDVTHLPLGFYNFKSQMIQYSFGNLSQTNPDFARSYIEQLVETPTAGPDETADLVYRLLSKDFLSSEHSIIEKLIRIPSQEVPRLFKAMHVDEVKELRESAIHRLSEISNPYLDQFLIDTYRNSGININEKWSYFKALMICDTPASREFVRKIWREDETVRRQCLLVMRNLEESPHILKQYLDEMAGVMEPELQVQAVQVLGIMNTPEAMEKLPAFLDSPNEEARVAARKDLEEYEKRIRLTNDLLTGKIEMDELAEPLPSFVWQGEGYERQF